MVDWVYAKAGKKFRPTKAANSEPHVLRKYAEDYAQRARYEKCVPNSWVKENLVEEVSIGKK